MTEKRFTIEIIEDKDVFIRQKRANHYLGVNGYVNGGMVVELLNELSEENEQLKQQVEDLYESDKSLRKITSNMTLNYTGICVPRRLFDEVLNILKDIEHNDLVEDLSKESIDTSANGG